MFDVDRIGTSSRIGTSRWNRPSRIRLELELLKLERTGDLVMKLSSHALRALQELDEVGRDAVEQIVRDHIRACRHNGFQPENLERVYQEAIEIIRLEGPPTKDLAVSTSKYEPTRRYEQYRTPRAL
jgi:hypothetical protein